MWHQNQVYVVQQLYFILEFFQPFYIAESRASEGHASTFSFKKKARRHMLIVRKY